MRSIVLLACVAAQVAAAAPLSFTFTGKTDYFHLWRDDGTDVASDASLPLWSAGIKIFNGNTTMHGHFTLDLDNMITADDCLFLPLSYQLSTQGAAWQRNDGWGCTDALEMSDTRLAWHVEGPNLTHADGLDSSIQDFVFNFVDGQFVGGHFTLDYMWGHDLYGSIGGTIHGLQRMLEGRATVPEPATALLLGSGLLGLGLWRRRCRAE